jgi:hypothetical protein
MEKRERWIVRVVYESGHDASMRDLDVHTARRLYNHYVREMAVIGVKRVEMNLQGT